MELAQIIVMHKTCTFNTAIDRWSRAICCEFILFGYSVGSAVIFSCPFDCTGNVRPLCPPYL